MTRAFDAAMRAAIAACVLFAVLAALATYLCATGALPCRDLAELDQCPLQSNPDAPVRSTLTGGLLLKGAIHGDD